MRVNLTHQQTLGLRILSEDQLEQIHYGTLEVLERTGVKVHEKEALELLHGAGARVEEPGQDTGLAGRTGPGHSTLRVGLAARDGSGPLLKKGTFITAPDPKPPLLWT